MCLRGEISNFVLLCFVVFCCVFVFIFRDLNKEDCNRHRLEKDLFHFIISRCVLKASPFVSQ